MAAGLEIREEMIPVFRERFEAYVRNHVEPELMVPRLHIDMEVGFDELNAELLDSYCLLEPFGNSNPQPVFMTRRVMLSSAPQHLAGNHLRLSLHQGNYEQYAMYFNAGSLSLPDPPWDIVYTIERNVWRGRVSLSITIQDLRSSQDAA